MPIADFIHLRVHSAYSLSEGAIKVKELIKLAVKQKMPAVAVTDTGNLFGTLEFAQAASDAGVQPIIGCQIALRRRSTSLKPGIQPEPDQLVLYAQTQQGYANLLELVSKSFMESESHESPQLDLADFEGRTDGLIALTGGPKGLIGRLLLDGQKPAAEAALGQLNALFPGRLYIELMRHGLPAEQRIEPDLLALAYANDLPLVATNDVFFSTEDMYQAHDALLCIAEGATLSQDERRRLTPEHRFKSADEMKALFADLPEAIANTLVIAKRCAAMPETRKPILPAFTTEPGSDEKAELCAMAEAGLEARLAAQPAFAPIEEYRARLDFELNVISKMGFAGYFLIVADFIQWAKKHGIPVGPGRGSGAGSVVAWALTITDLDPIRFGLLFERFLNPERVSMPDFDIDFCQERRDEVIRYVQDRYGHDRVAQIITFGKLQARAVLRDVGRVMEMPYGQVDRICKLVPNNPANPVTLEEAIKGEPILQAMRDEDEQVARLLSVGMKLEGLYRHASTHAAGVVIADRPLERLVPLYRDPRSDMPVTQFNMKYVESAGLVKFDFLGLKTLTVLAQAIELIALRGPRLDLATLPLDDAKTFEMLSRGDATGVFQLESSGMRDVLRKLKPDRFEDIIAVVALYRPGPMDNIPSYIARKHGAETPDYLHPLLEPTLKETFGIAIYQEQVMQIAQLLSGYSLGGADLLRRAMGKKIKAEMDAQRETFLQGAEKNGVEPKTASHIFDQVEKFAGYGFNKSHAAAYALVSYQTAYLKAHYPVEFFAASMTLDLGNTDKLNVFRQELSKLDVKLLPPDINRSGATFLVEDVPGAGPAVRYALAAVKNVGDQAMRALVRERTEKGPFKDLFDFATRLDPRQVNKRQLENLAAAGTFDSLNPNRAQTYAAIEMLLRHASLAAEERTSDQIGMFGGDAVPAPKPKLPTIAAWEPPEQLQREFDAVGFYLSAHPLDDYKQSMGRLGCTRAVDLAGRVKAGATRVKVAGIVLGRQERMSARGNRFAFVQMSDASGTFEIAFFSEILAIARPLLESGKPLLVSAEAKADDEGARLTAQAVEPLEQAAKNVGSGLRITVAGTEPLDGLKRALSASSSGGKGRVMILFDMDSRAVEMSLKGGYAVSPQLRAEIKRLPGIVEVQEL
jgi:DNA polymerase-3 subunit alpha